jgi:hypothetical protein
VCILAPGAAGHLVEHGVEDAVEPVVVGLERDRLGAAVLLVAGIGLELEGLVDQGRAFGLGQRLVLHIDEGRAVRLESTWPLDEEIRHLIVEDGPVALEALDDLAAEQDTPAHAGLLRGGGFDGDEL